MHVMCASHSQILMYNMDACICMNEQCMHSSECICGHACYYKHMPACMYAYVWVDKQHIWPCQACKFYACMHAWYCITILWNAC